MGLPVERALEGIRLHSAGLADVAEGRLDQDVPSCPGWSMADLTYHLAATQHVWAWVAEHLPTSVPEDVKPPRPADDELPGLLRAQTARLVEVLGGADQSAACWTWFPGRQDVGFITRHQVQEAAVHHWDAANATSASTAIEDDLAVDAIDEFLTCSIATDEQPWPGRMERPAPPLGGRLLLHVPGGASWTITDATTPNAISVERHAVTPATGTVIGSAGDLLLWLYGRVELPTDNPDLVTRFRAFTFTD